MKITLIVLAATFALLGVSAAYAERELKVEFRLQPDGSGGKTRNQGIEIDGDEVVVYLDGDEREIETSGVDADGLFQLIAAGVREFEMVEGARVRPPYIEVKMEFSGEDREIEVSRSYPLGGLPSELVKVQERYLDEVWQ